MHQVGWVILRVGSARERITSVAPSNSAKTKSRNCRSKSSIASTDHTPAGSDRGNRLCSREVSLAKRIDTVAEENVVVETKTTARTPWLLQDNEP